MSQSKYSIAMENAKKTYFHKREMSKGQSQNSFMNIYNQNKIVDFDFKTAQSK